MRDFLSQFKRDFALTAAACIVLGLLLLIYPEMSGTIIAVILALILAAIGIMHIITYFFRRYPDDIGRMDLVFGVVAAVVAVWLFLKPEVLIGFLPTVLGILLIVDGIVKLENAIDLLRIKAERWWIILLLAVISGAAGVVALMNPFKTGTVLLMFTGGALIADGLFDLFTLFTLHRKVKRFRKKLADAETKANAIEAEGREE